MNSMKSLSRFAGVGYLIIFVTGIFANFFVLEGLIVYDDAAATVQNILNNDSLFRIGILSFVLMVIFDVLLAWALYLLLKPVSIDLSLLSGWLRLANSVIFAVALFNLFDVLHVTGGANYMQLMDSAILNSRVMISLNSFNSTWLIGLILFGLHLFVLGYLIHKSGYIPKFIGVLLIIAGVGYLVDSFANFLLPNYTDYKDIFMMIVVIPGIVGELSLTFWLLIKGVKNDGPKIAD